MKANSKMRISDLERGILGDAGDALRHPSTGGDVTPSFPITSVLDDFNRGAEGPPPSASWTKTWTEQYSLKVNATQQCIGSGNGWSECYWNVASFTNLECYITMVTKGLGDNILGVYANTTACVGGTWAVQDGYAVEISITSGVDIIRMVRFDDSVSTVLSSVNKETASGDSIGMRIMGTELRMYYKPSGGLWIQIGNTVFDTTYTGTKYIGFGVGTGNIGVFDNFGGGTL